MHELIPSSSFHLGGVLREVGYHSYVVDIRVLPIQMIPFGLFSMIRTARMQNVLFADTIRGK